MSAVTPMKSSANTVAETGEVIKPMKKPSSAAAADSPVRYTTAYFVIQPPITTRYVIMMTGTRNVSTPRNFHFTSDASPRTR